MLFSRDKKEIKLKSRLVAILQFNFLVHPMGFEPMTPRLKVWCYFQLSYGCKLFVRFSHAFSFHIFYFLSYLVYIL